MTLRAGSRRSSWVSAGESSASRCGVSHPGQCARRCTQPGSSGTRSHCGRSSRSAVLPTSLGIRSGLRRTQRSGRCSTRRAPGEGSGHAYSAQVAGPAIARAPAAVSTTGIIPLDTSLGSLPCERRSLRSRHARSHVQSYLSAAHSHHDPGSSHGQPGKHFGASARSFPTPCRCPIIRSRTRSPPGRPRFSHDSAAGATVRTSGASHAMTASDSSSNERAGRAGGKCRWLRRC